MIANPSAKVRFLQNSTLVTQHQDMVSLPIFQVSLDHALLHYMEELQANSGSDLNKAAAGHLRLLGAREFVFVLRNLGEKEAPPSPRKDNINLITRPN